MTATTLAERPDAAIVAAQARLDQITAEVAALFAARKGLLDSTVLELGARGVEAYRVDELRFRASTHVGDVVHVFESFNRLENGRIMRRLAASRNAWSHQLPLSVSAYTPRESSCAMHIGRGLAQVVLKDDRDILVAAIPGQDTEAGHRGSVSRLRNLARKDDLRVRVRDRDITLIDPLGNRVHEGDIISGFAFLLNIDIAIAEVW